jgi:hypothetical protein
MDASDASGQCRSARRRVAPSFHDRVPAPPARRFSLRLLTRGAGRGGVCNRALARRRARCGIDSASGLRASRVRSASAPSSRHLDERERARSALERRHRSRPWRRAASASDAPSAHASPSRGGREQRALTTAVGSTDETRLAGPGRLRDAHLPTHGPFADCWPSFELAGCRNTRVEHTGSDGARFSRSREPRCARGKASLPATRLDVYVGNVPD